MFGRNRDSHLVSPREFWKSGAKEPGDSTFEFSWGLAKGRGGEYFGEWENVLTSG